MTSVTETQEGKHQLASTLEDGVQQISENQVVTFTLYRKVTLPVDGSVFYIKASDSFEAKGSLHYATSQNQNQDESVAVNAVVFTSLQEVNSLNDIGEDELYIGEFEGLRFAFSQRKSYYKQAGLFHYAGDAVYPYMETQLVDTLGALFEQLSVVSNSLPIWLTLNQYVDLYPSFLVAQNLRPPYAAIHIGPTDTEALQAVPSATPVYQEEDGEIVTPLRITSTLRNQLTKDRVRITLWGMRADQAAGFMDYLLNYMTNHDDLGLMNMPIIRDEKKTQSELNILGQKKVIEFEVSYYQSRAYDCAKQLILSALPQYILGV